MDDLNLNPWKIEEVKRIKGKMFMKTIVLEEVQTKAVLRDGK
jgi:hypothetical protein